MRLRCLVLLGCALLLMAPGCGKYKTVKVSGIVTLDGVAVDGASVTFLPIDDKGEPDDKRQPATARSASDGKFQLTTRNRNDGAMPGPYKVTVTLEQGQDAPAGMATGPGGAMRPDQTMKMMQDFAEQQRKGTGGQGAKPKAKETKIPASYGDFKTTPLRATVPAEKEIDLALSSKGG